VTVDRGAVHDAYRSTSYRANVGLETIELRIAARSPALDVLLRARGVSCWAFVTASNPHATQLPDAENASRFAALVRVVEAEAFSYFAGEGVGDDGHWPPEASVLVLGIGEAAAVALARRFEQEAIVVGEEGAAARLVLCAEPPA
jgi:hypothetical protein